MTYFLFFSIIYLACWLALLTVYHKRKLRSILIVNSFKSMGSSIPLPVDYIFFSFRVLCCVDQQFCSFRYVIMNSNKAHKTEQNGTECEGMRQRKNDSHNSSQNTAIRQTYKYFVMRPEGFLYFIIGQMLNYISDSRHCGATNSS